MSIFVSIYSLFTGRFFYFFLLCFVIMICVVFLRSLCWGRFVLLSYCAVPGGLVLLKVYRRLSEVDFFYFFLFFLLVLCLFFLYYEAGRLGLHIGASRLFVLSLL